MFITKSWSCKMMFVYQFFQTESKRCTCPQWKFETLHPYCTTECKPSTPLVELYKNMNLLLHVIEYERCSWKIYGHLRVIRMLMGRQSGFTKYYCFVCLWDSWTTNKHYVESNWPPRPSSQPALCNVKNIPLVDPGNVLLPPLYIKLVLMKHFIKVLRKRNSRGFDYVVEKFPKITLEGGYIC